jgi:hypothetical protein
MAITQAALTRPLAFKKVRGMIFESPLSSLTKIDERLCAYWTQNSACANVLGRALSLIAKLRSDIDFERCFAKTAPPVEVPTELWLSHAEFKDPTLMALAKASPAHRNLSIKVFDRGTHSAYYGYEPEAVEEALHDFWKRVKEP